TATTVAATRPLRSASRESGKSAHGTWFELGTPASTAASAQVVPGMTPTRIVRSSATLVTGGGGGRALPPGRQRGDLPREGNPPPARLGVDDPDDEVALALHEHRDDLVPVLDRDDLQLELARAGEALEQLALEPGVVPPLEGEELGHLVGGDEDAQTTRE